jgi:hypothetical protein
MPPEEQDLRQRDIDLRAADQRSLWLSSPLLLAIVGLIGTGIGAGLQGFWNARLEKQKFESSLVEKALSAANRDEAAKSLKFLVDAGLVNGLNTDNITKLAAKPAELPAFLGTAIRDRLISIQEAKSVLTHLGLFSGPINDEADDAFRRSVASFQASRNMAADGLIGPLTLLKLREAWPEHFKPTDTGQ